MDSIHETSLILTASSSSILQVEKDKIEKKTDSLKEKIWKGALVGSLCLTGVLGVIALTLPIPFTLLLFAVVALVTGILFAAEGIKRFKKTDLHQLKELIPFFKGIGEEIYSLGFMIRHYFTIDLSKENTFKKGQPILLIHGLFLNSSGWKKIYKQLEKDGFGPIYTMNLSSTTQKIKEGTTEVEIKIQEIVHETGRHDLVLVGHSTGGVLALFAASGNKEKEVDTVITLGSPINGTKTASILPFVKNTQDMRYEEGETSLKIRLQNTKVNLYHMASTSDLLVVPQNSAAFGDLEKENVTIFPYLGHLSYLTNQKVYDSIKSILQKPKQQKET